MGGPLRFQQLIQSFAWCSGAVESLPVFCARAAVRLGPLAATAILPIEPPQ